MQHNSDETLRAGTSAKRSSTTLHADEALTACPLITTMATDPRRNGRCLSNMRSSLLRACECVGNSARSKRDKSDRWVSCTDAKGSAKRTEIGCAQWALIRRCSRARRRQVPQAPIDPTVCPRLKKYGPASRLKLAQDMLTDCIKLKKVMPCTRPHNQIEFAETKRVVSRRTRNGMQPFCNAIDLRSPLSKLHGLGRQIKRTDISPLHGQQHTPLPLSATVIQNTFPGHIPDDME